MINDQYMSLGEWELTLEPDTPKEIRDKIIGFSEVVIMPGRVRAEDMVDDLLADALFRGTVFRPGPQFTIGGHGPACWLGWGDRFPTVNIGGLDLPYLNIISVLGGTLTTWLANVTDDSPISAGTYTDPTSGSQTIAKSIQWISKRELLDNLCKEWEVEWRINMDFTLDVGPFTTLYPSRTALLTPTAAGREQALLGLETLLRAETDLWDYASRMYLLGATQIGVAGGYTSFYAPDGQRLWITAVANEADVQLNATDLAAARLLSTMSDPSIQHRTVTASSDMFTISGDVRPGSRVYVHDPDAGLSSQILSSLVAIEWRGQTIYPIGMRVLGLRWPVRDGMGVLLRRHTGDTTVSSTGTKEYVDLTPYVQWESGSSELTIMSDRSFHWKVL